ncbi:peptidase M24, structural domain-containing protein [Cubamyces lactineus]|nr:peptidase M24, structural domain-containing protein [Cubamyces lactineus]
MSSVRRSGYVSTFGFHIRDAAELQAYCVRHNLHAYQDRPPAGVDKECQCFGMILGDLRKKLKCKIHGVADAWAPGPPGPNGRHTHIYVVALAQEVSTKPITDETRNRRAEEIPKPVIEGVKQLLDRTDDPVWYESCAIIHYDPNPNNCAIVRKDKIYLCDSGGKAYPGPVASPLTFVNCIVEHNSAMHLGTSTAEERRAFMRVLQGHIAIDTAVFPNGTTGYLLDPFARRPLWEDGLDYRHGTGHGVGHFLNVHEGPHGIGVRIAYNNTPLKPGMTVSNEPGYYKDGQYGIRIENIVIVREAQTPNNFGDKGYLRFEHVTMNLIETSLLSAKEREWLDTYHAEILEKVSPLVKADERALRWLQRECSPL